MHYLPTLDLWDNATAKAIHNGQIKLQVGQWVTCGGREKHRFVGATKHTLVVSHPMNGKIDKVNFKALRDYYKRINNQQLELKF